MKRFLAFAPIVALTLALSGGAAAYASDYYVTDDGGYVYDTNNDWYTTAPTDTYGYYDPTYVYSTPDPYYNTWYGPGIGVGINIGGDHDYWRHSNFDRGGFRGDVGVRGGSVRGSASFHGGVRGGGGHDGHRR